MLKATINRLPLLRETRPAHLVVALVLVAAAALPAKPVAAVAAAESNAALAALPEDYLEQLLHGDAGHEDEEECLYWMDGGCALYRGEEELNHAEGKRGGSNADGYLFRSRRGGSDADGDGYLFRSRRREEKKDERNTLAPKSYLFRTRKSSLLSDKMDNRFTRGNYLFRTRRSHDGDHKAGYFFRTRKAAAASMDRDQKSKGYLFRTRRGVATRGGGYLFRTK